MKQAIITLKKKEIIDSSTNWKSAKEILSSAYNELLEQLKFTSHQFQTWEEVKKMTSEDAIIAIENNVYKAIMTHIHNYRGKIPTGLSDITNTIDLNFLNIIFNIVEADFTSNSLVVSLSFITDKLTLIDSLSDNLLISIGDKTKSLESQETECFLIQMNSSTSIYSYISVK
jgi:hypothetical protein